ncbi:hypothetical protein EMCG_06812 [[Emmonsia] crescens]|uniref:DUF1996 domain-containing protein n=1 Tax=[Emmonsia] crescens TaxID=73230 RepID=A0A0G2IAH5_9EURO|nr:hypothetical protein EMCG_06812 [Emmonsia crescens UAMH 3008]
MIIYIFYIILVSTVTRSAAFWHLPCQGQLRVVRMNSLVNSGKVSIHAHTIHGGSDIYSFDFSVTTSSLLQSECTSCAVKQNLSVY